MSSRPLFIVRLTHTGSYANGRPNTSPVLVQDLDVGYEYQDRKVPVYVPPGGSVDIPASSRSMLSFDQGPIYKLTNANILRSKMFFVPESYTLAELPPASEYPPGTHVWSTTDNRAYWSDGTNWTASSSPTGAAGGDLSGTYPNPEVIKLRNIPIQDFSTLSNGDSLVYNAATNEWEHAPIVFGGGPPVGPAGGDLFGIYPNPSIALGAITEAKIAPANIDGLAATPSLRTLGTGAQQAAAGNDPRFSDPRAPNGPAGGDLTGTYPNPTIALGAVTPAKVNPANVDGLAAAPSLRTLGTGPQQATAGNDPRLSNARVPTGAAGGDLTGTYPSPYIALGVVSDVKVAAANKDGLAAVPSMRTLGTGAQQAAAGNDPRLSDPRTPAGLAGGDLAGTYPNPTLVTVGTTGTYGSASKVPVYTTDTKGRVVSTVETPIQIDITQVTGLSADLSSLSSSKADKSTSIFAGVGLTGGGDLSTDRTISMPNVGTAGTYGTVSQVPVLSTDAQGRVTGVVNTAIQIDETQVTNLISDLTSLSSGISSVNAALAFKADKTVTIAAGTGLTGGGDLSTDRTISMPNVGIAGTYGTASSVPVITTDAQGRVGNVTNTPISIDASQVTGLALDLSSKADKTTTIATTNGLQGGGDLATNRTLSPVYGSTGGTVTEGNDPRLSDARIPTGPAGGDLAGTYPNPTVASLNGNSVAATSPTSGQVLTWNGSAWVPGANATGGSGGGGVTYFLNYSTAGQAPLTGLSGSTKELGLIADGTTSTLTTGVLGTGGVYTFVEGFVTKVNDPNLSVLSAGLWDINVWASSSNPTPNDISFHVSVHTYDGTTKTLLGTSPEAKVFDPLEVTQYTCTVVIPQTVLVTTDRLYVELEATAVSPGTTVTFSFGGTTPSHAHTTVPSVSGTGVVHVVNGVLQTPAAPVNLAGGSTEITGALPVANGGTGLSTYTTGDIIFASSPTTLSLLNDVVTGNVLLSGGLLTGPLYGKVGLTTHVDGVLPVTNGGTGLSSTPTNGQLLIGTGSGFVGANLSSGSGISITNGVGSITIANTGVLSVGASAPLASSGGATPNLTLLPSGVGSGGYGSASSVPVVTITTEGLVATAVDTPILIDKTQVINLTTDLGTKADKVTTISAGAGLTGGGDLSANRTIAMPDVGSPGTYGAAAQVPVFSTDQQGRVTSVVNTSIQISEAQVTNLVTDLGTKADKITTISAGAGLTGGGDLSTNRTIAMPNVGTASTYGSASSVPVFTTDAQGRVSSVTNTAIAIDASQITSGLTSIQQKVYQTATNTAAGGITVGQVVYVTNSNGSGTAPPVQLAQANAFATVGTVIGLAAESIANNATGLVITRGLLGGLNTQAYTQGDVLYVSPSTPGALTNVKPTGPNYALPVGIVVVRNASVGVIYVCPGNVNTIANIEDIVLTSPVENDFLKYNPTTNQWNNAPVLKQPNTQTAVTLSAGNQILAANFANVVYLPIKTAGGANITLAANPIISLNNNSTDWGRVLWLHNVDNNRSITFPAGGNTKLAGGVNLVLAASSIVKFIWTSVGSGGSWIQTEAALTVG